MDNYAPVNAVMALLLSKVPGRLFFGFKKVFTLCLITTVIFFIFSACGDSHVSQDGGDDSPACRYLALGDSYVIGESVADGDRWPHQLTGRLRSEGFDIADPYIIAKTGWTTDELIQGIDTAVITGTYDMVSLLIGVNNQYRGRDIESFRQEFRNLLSRAVTFAGDTLSRVIVLSIPDWGVTPFGAASDREWISEEIDAFNSVIKEEAEAVGIRYFDITSISRRAAEDASLTADDDLHPSAEMYSLWVDLILPEVLDILACCR